jgi:hypothetical protein
MTRFITETVEHSKRWVGTIYYRTDAGLINIELEMDELEELQEIVERGPNWFALERIEVRHAFQKGTETIEQLDSESARPPLLRKRRRMPKKKEPELTPEEQFKRFQEAAKEHEIEKRLPKIERA